MNIYFAPLEGITGYSYRNAHHRLFTGIDRYYTPFVAPNYTHHFKGKEKADVAPENNTDLPLVPQILSNRAEDFLWAAGELYDRGYREINLNLGCPMPTVVRKKRGAGQLADLDALDRFLEEICEGMDSQYGLCTDTTDAVSDRGAAASGAEISSNPDIAGSADEKGREKEQSSLRFSVKTRIGVDDTSRAADLLRIYNRYPVCELTVHPRTQKDMYKNTPDLEVFGMFLEGCVHQVVYNGDICSMEDLLALRERFPQVDTVMIGRGLITNPALARELQGGVKLCKRELRSFHDALYEAAVQTLPGTVPILGRMKELWFYMGANFRNADRCLKEIRKSRNLVQYQAAVRTLFAQCEL